MSTNNHEGTGSSKISEAIEILNEAAKEKADELKGLMGDKCVHIRQAIMSGAEQGREKVKEIAGNVDKRVHQDPWVYIAGAAAGSLLLGYFLGSKRK